MHTFQSNCTTKTVLHISQNVIPKKHDLKGRPVESPSYENARFLGLAGLWKMLVDPAV